MRFELLGPLHVHGPAGTVALGGRQHRLVLATLLARVNRAVPVEVLGAALWGARPDGKQRGALRVLVHHLRRALGADAIDRVADGYRLVVAPGRVDAHEFTALVRRAGRLSADGRRRESRDAFRDALDLWRGAAFEDHDQGDLVRQEAARLQEVRLAAYEECFDLELDLGLCRTVTAEIRALAAEHPLRERIQEQLVRALAGSDRRAEALATYDRTRRLLADELGIDPGERLLDLQRRILRGEPVGGNRAALRDVG